MRQAPPVSVVCHGRRWRAFQVLVFALSAAAVAAWLAQHAGLSDRWAAGIAAGSALAIGSLALWGLRGAPVALTWDGQRWWADGQPVDVHLMLDVAGSLLLRLNPASGAGRRWLGVSAQDAAGAWHALRAALYAHRPLATVGFEGQIDTAPAKPVARGGRCP